LSAVGAGCLDEGGGTRTHDLGIKSPLLYQLSYAPVGRMLFDLNDLRHRWHRCLVQDEQHVMSRRCLATVDDRGHR
jgi:hypothetical protein